MWEIHFAPIVGVSIGIEYYESEEEEAWIWDFFFIRTLFYKEL